jgi:hypothetical protein
LRDFYREKNILVFSANSGPPYCIAEHRYHRRQLPLAAEVWAIFIQNVKILAGGPSCCGELIRVQSQVEVYLLQDSATAPKNLRIEDHKMFGITLTVSGFRVGDQTSISKTVFPEYGDYLVAMHFSRRNSRSMLSLLWSVTQTHAGVRLSRRPN